MTWSFSKGELCSANQCPQCDCESEHRGRSSALKAFVSVVFNGGETVFYQAAEAGQEEGRILCPYHLVNMFLDLPASLSVLQEACSCHAQSVWIATVISPT